MGVDLYTFFQKSGNLLLTTSQVQPSREIMVYGVLFSFLSCVRGGAKPCSDDLKVKEYILTRVIFPYFYSK